MIPQVILFPHNFTIQILSFIIQIQIVYVSNDYEILFFGLN